MSKPNVFDLFDYWLGVIAPDRPPTKERKRMKINKKKDISKIHAMQILSERLLKRAIYTCLLLGCCTACNDEECSRTVTTEKLSPLAIGMVHLDGEEVPGRAALGMGEVIGVFATNAPGVSSYTNRYNVKYTSNGSTWSSTAPVMLGIENAAISAYHPYKNETMTGSELKLTSQYYQDSEDISFAKAQNRNSTSTSSATIKFSMNRAYSQIEFVLNRAASYTGPFKIDKIGIKNAGIIGSCNLDVATGTYSSRTVNADFSYIPDGTGIGGNQETSLTSAVLMVPPASPPSGKFTIDLTIDGTVNSVDINALALEAGTKYKVTLNFEGIYKITVSQVTVEDWQSVPITPDYPL